jgi:hypothetical protein
LAQQPYLKNPTGSGYIYSVVISLIQLSFSKDTWLLIYEPVGPAMNPM